MTFPTLPLMVATVFGGFLFPFLIWLLWGKLVENFGTFGGWMAALFIVGTTWTINHGVMLRSETCFSFIRRAL